MNKSQAKLVLSVKYHTLGKDNQWRWLPGDLTTADSITQTFEPGEAGFFLKSITVSRSLTAKQELWATSWDTLFAAMDKPRIQADRIRVFIWNDKNEAVSDEYWKKDLVLVEQAYQGYVPERFTFTFSGP